MKRKLFGLLLALTLILSCFVGMVLVADAEGANKIVFAAGDLTVDELGVEGATYATDIMVALAELDQNSRKHPADTVAEIHFKGSLTGGDQNNLLFAQKTIWREDGTKLPIAIIGHDTATERDAYIYLDGIGGWYTCANDYSFSNLTLPVGDQVTYFYAGSGNIRMDDVNLTSSGGVTVATVEDRTNTFLNSKAVATYIAEDAANLITPDVYRLPTGDAWQAVRNSAEYHATGTVKTDKNGDAYVDKDPTGADGSPYGDYAHSGNTGGGQYLNACVYYEVILGLDCRNNDWTPTSYALDEDLRKILQNAAHEAVLEVYGQEYFTNPPKYDINDDGIVNLLMIGSSSSFYMRDELHLMAKHVGIELRVVHAYSSGIKMNTIWSWAENNTAKWTVHTDYTNAPSPKNGQKFTDYVASYPWDAVTTYQTGNALGKKALGGGHNETTVATAIADVGKADEFINKIYNYNEDNAKARYFWFQVVGSPIGAPGPGSDAEGYVFGDNNTTAAYAGWTEADLERYSENGKLVSSVTMGEHMDFGTRINAVGYQLTAPDTPYTDETAAAVKFDQLEGYENAPDVLPVNTVGKLILDSDTAAIDMTPIKRGYSPASAELHVKKGSGGDVYAYGYNASGLTKYGDITFRWTGGSVGRIDLIDSSNITGDLNVIIDLPEGSTASTITIRTVFGSSVITGDVNVFAKNLTVTGSIFSGGSTGGTVTNTFTNCIIKEDFIAVRIGSCGRIVNTLTNCTVTGKYVGGHWSGDSTTVGPVINKIDSLTLGGTYYGGSWHGGNIYKAKVQNGAVEVNGKTESLAVYNDIKSLTAAGTFSAGSSNNSCGNIRNDIDTISCATFYGAGTSHGTSGNITTNINKATVTGAFYGGSSSKTGNATKNITTEIDRLTLDGNFYGGNVKSAVNGAIKTTLRGGTVGGNFYGGNNSTAVKNVKNVTNTVSGVEFTGAFYGGSVEGNAAAITNIIQSGTFNAAFYGGGNGTATSVQNTVSGGTFEQNFYGGGAAGNITSISNTVEGGTFKQNFYGGTYSGTPSAITNTVSGGSFEGRYAGANYQGTVAGTVQNLINGGTFSRFNGGFVCEVAGEPMVVEGDLINTLKGNVRIEKTFAGVSVIDDYTYKTTVNGSVINTFDRDEKGNAPDVGSPATDSASFGYFGAGHHPLVKGGIVNRIYAGTFRKIFQGGVFYLETGSLGLVPEKYVPEGVETGKFSIINCFEGGNFVKVQDNRDYVWSGICGIGAKYPDGTMAGGVYTLAEGATFDVRFYTGNRSFAASETQPIVTKIKSGTFGSTVLLSGGHTGSTSIPATPHTAIATVEGGTFNGKVYAGQNNGGSVTSCSVTVKGGTFNSNLYAGSATKSGVTTVGTYTLTLEPSVGDITLTKALGARNDLESIALKGGSKQIKLTADATIAASSYDGAAFTLHREEGWTKGTTYLTLPTAQLNASVTATKGADKAGDLKMVVSGNETHWIGMDSTSLYAANLILDQKIGLRLWLDKAAVDAIGADFTYAFTCEGIPAVAGNYEDLLAKAEILKNGETEYYTMTLGGLEPASFHKVITFGGDGLNTASYSINDLLGIVIANEDSAFNEGFVTLAKSLWNYGIEAYNRFSGESSVLAKQALSAPTDAEIIASAVNGDVADAKLVGRALVLRDAVGIRLYLNLQNGVKAEDLSVSVNGAALDQALIHAREESGEGYNASLTLYVSAGAMEAPLSITLSAGDAFVGSYTDSVASICQQYRNAGAVDAQLCTAILRYIQAVPGMND